MHEAARCMEEAQAARAAGLAREQQLAGEIRALRQQLEGRLPQGDPAKGLQVGTGAGAGAGVLLVPWCRLPLRAFRAAGHEAAFVVGLMLCIASPQLG